MTLSESPLAASYQNALRAANEAAGQQNYEPGTLYVVATPIGNLADISLRALHVLQMVDALACEDTRHTQTMLRAYGIDRSSAQLLAVHQHNEVQATQSIIERLQGGARLAYVSDAGTPAISDPGARLVAAARLAGLRVVPVPGASSVTTLLSAAGIPPDTHQTTGFVFQGFLPSKTSERATAVAALSTEHRAVVLLEAPHRIEALAQSLAILGDRVVTIGRELTKQFEEIATCRALDLPGWLAHDVNRLRGEFTLVIHPVNATANTEPDTRVLYLLLSELPLKTAVKLATEITGESRNTLYELALRWKSQAPPSGD
jgi:16S rRNA (cytidine1402-2'-O)-methyltransferase